MKPSEFFREDASRFCHRAIALDRRGRNCLPESPRAVRWGALGAYWLLMPKSEHENPYLVASQVCRARYNIPLSHQPDVEKAIECLEAAGI